MANQHRGEVAIKIGDRSYVAKFDFNAIVCLETHFGSVSNPKPLQEIFAKGQQVPTSLIPVMLWATLNGLYADEFPDVRAVATKLDLSDLSYLSGKVTELFKYAQTAISKANGADRPTVAATAAAQVEEASASIGLSSVEPLPRQESVSTSSGV